MVRRMYHTQERWDNRLKAPIICVRNDAWLGDAYYYWLNEDDAKNWGINSKRATGWYEVYQSDINCENVLDTVFNEKHYNLWLKTIEKVAKIIAKATYNKPTLKELNDYLKERGDWSEVDGIMFQDLPNKEYYTLIKPIIYKDKVTQVEKKVYFTYRKRIQLAVFNEEVILSFAHFLTEECY
jgi:hypothetical protein